MQSKTNSSGYYSRFSSFVQDDLRGIVTNIKYELEFDDKFNVATTIMYIDYQPEGAKFKIRITLGGGTEIIK